MNAAPIIIPPEQQSKDPLIDLIRYSLQSGADLKLQKSYFQSCFYRQSI